MNLICLRYVCVLLEKEGIYTGLVWKHVPWKHVHSKASHAAIQIPDRLLSMCSLLSCVYTAHYTVLALIMRWGVEGPAHFDPKWAIWCDLDRQSNLIHPALSAQLYVELSEDPGFEVGWHFRVDSPEFNVRKSRFARKD